MLFYTHLIFAFLSGLFAIRYFSISDQILFIILVLFSGLLPDIDSPNSKFGKYFKHLMPFKHRGFIHSLIVLPVIAFILYYFNYSRFSLPIIVGYISHLIGDAITKEGIMPFYPFSGFRIKGFIRTGGLIEQILFIALMVVSAYFLLYS